MKLLGFLILLGLMTACDPWGFGFKKNPAYVLNEAFEAILNEDPEALVEVTGKEALCLYGNVEGVTYLKNNLNIDKNDVDIKHKLVENSARYTKSPQFVGYWSYYNERYIVNIVDKNTKDEYLKILVECHYGFEGQKSDKYQNLKLKKYKKKECRAIKLLPFKFPVLPMREECEPLAVKL